MTHEGELHTAADSSCSSSDHRVVDHEHHDRADNRNQQAVEIESGDTAGAKEREQEASDDGPDDTKNEVEDKAFARLVDDPAGDEARNEAEH